MQNRILLGALAMVWASLLAGCHNPPRSDTAATEPAARASAGHDGARLWADNCSRCHNARPPGSYSDTQWEAVTHHMRLRADLTGAEARAVTEFLKAAH